MASKERIAIIDDDTNLRRTLSDILSHYGYQPHGYANGQAAMEDILHGWFAVVLLDLRLEDFSGLEVLRFIKRHSPGTACIFLTGYASQDSAIEAVNAGAYSYFIKPVNIEQLLVTIRRAIEKRQADLALVESERHYQALADVAPVGIFRTDAQGNTTYVNPRWTRISGFSSEQALGSGWFNALHPEDRPRIEQGWQETIAKRQVSAAEYRFLHQDGSITWVIGQAQPEFDASGNFTGYIGTITDITSRKQIEEDLRNSEARYRLITDHIEDIVWQMDVNFRFTYVSPAVMRVMGYTPEEACQHKVTDFLDDNGIFHLQSLIQKHMWDESPAAPTPFEYQMQHKNGQWVPVEVVSSAVYSPDRTLIGFVGVTRDITERKRIEKTLKENEQRIKRLLDQQIAINQLALALGESLELDVIYQTIYKHIQTMTDAWVFIVSSYDEQTQLIRAEYAVNAGERLDTGRFPPLKLAPTGSGNQSQAIHTGQPVYVPDHRAASGRSKKRYAFEKDGQVYDLNNADVEPVEETLSALYVPMKAKGRYIGIMQLQSQRLNAYSEQDIQLLTGVANLAAVAIQNARLHSDVQRELIERKRAEEQLRLQSTALQAAANAIIITDAQGNIQYANPAFVEQTGYTLDEVLGQNPRFLKSGVHDQAFYADMWNTILSGKTWRSELVNRHKDGRLIDIEAAITPLANENGVVTNFIGIKQDISDRKQTEAAIKRHISDLEALYDNGLKLARLFEKNQITQCIIDLLENRLHWHHAVLRLYNAKDDVMEVIGYSQAGADPTMRERLPTISIKRDMGMTGWAWKNATVLRCGNLSEDPRYLETYTGMKSGIYVPMMAGDHVLGVISVESEQPDAFSDADERLLVTLAAQVGAAFDNARLYSETLQRLEELNTLVQVSAALRTATGHAEMLPVILEQTMLVVHASGAAFAFRDPATQETVFELGSGDLANHTQQRLPPGLGITNWVLDHGETYFCNNPGTDPLYFPPVPADRSPRCMIFAPLISQENIIGVLLVSSQNVIESNQVNLLGTIANIAANAMHRSALHERILNYAAELEKRVEERTAELRAANLALERASRAKDEFLASMSHELRTPLTGILNLSEVLQEQLYGPLNEKQLHYTHIIEESGRHLLGLINDILDLSKIEAGQMSVEFDLVQLDSICQACLQLTRGLANKKGQTVNFSIDPRSIALQADARRLKQMLVNLLSNAVKFTPQGGEIGLEVTGDEQAAMVYITVWDTGIGIAQEDFMRLFLPFSQLDGSLARQHEGTGLGLAIAQRLANMHGGNITLESAPGQGSRFTIHLPWRKLPPEAQETRSEEPAGWASGSVGARAASVTPAHTLLLADDNQTTAEIYTDFLTQNGFHIIQARTGQDALDLARQQRPHLILMDIQMPGMDGLTAIQRLRAMPDQALARTPIIALTALAMPGDRERCLEAGADDYLDKPVSLKNLLQVVKSYLKLP